MSDTHSWSAVDKLRGAFELLRDMLIASLLALLILSPKVVGDRLRMAGITEVSLPGITAKLQEATQQTEEANQRIVVLQQNLDDASTQIRQLRTLAPSPEAQRQIDTLQTKIESTRTQTNATRDALGHSLAVQHSIANEIGAPTSIRKLNNP